MGNTTRIVLILVLILGVGVLAKVLDRNIDNTPSGPDQVTGRGPTDQPRANMDARFQPLPTDKSKPTPPVVPAVQEPTEDRWVSTGGSAPVTFPREGAMPGSDLNQGPVQPDGLADGGTPAAGDSITPTDPVPTPVRTVGADEGSDLGRPTDSGAVTPRGDGLGSVEPPSLDDRTNVSNAVARDRDLSEERDEAKVTPPVAPTPTAVPGFPRKYRVQDGDSLWGIAAAHYQRPELYRLILAANPALGDGELLKAGEEITIPAPPTAATKPQPVVGEPKPVSEPKPGVAVRPVATGMVAYVVREGDTLYGIARDRFGDVTRVADILKANPGLDPLTLHVGKTIQIPAK